MNSSSLIESMHDRLMQAKTLERLSFRKLGVVIGYSNEGMNNAMKKKTLSEIQIKKLVDHFNLHNYFDSFDSNVSNNETLNEVGTLIKKSVMIVNDNWDHAMEIPAFRNNVETQIAKRMLFFKENPEEYKKWIKGIIS